MIEDLKIANWKLQEAQDHSKISRESGFLSPSGVSDAPRGSGDNRQFLEVDLKENDK